MKKPLRIFKYFFIVLILILIGIYTLLPFIVTYSLPGIVERAGFGKLKLFVKKISLTSIDLDSLEYGEEANPAATISSIDADFSVWSLIADKRVDSLTLTGAEVKCSYDGKMFSFSGLEFPDMPKSPSVNNSKPFMISSIEIRNSVLDVDYQGRYFAIPFELKYFPGKTWKEGQGKLSLFFKEQPVKADFSFNSTTMNISLDVKDFNLKSIYDLLPEGEDVSGYLTSNISVETELSPFFVKSLKGYAILKDGKWRSKGNEISLPVVELKANGSNENFEAEVSPVSIVQNNKELAKLSSFKLDISAEEKTVSGTTALEIETSFTGVKNSIPLKIKCVYSLPDKTKNPTIKSEIKSEAVALQLPQSQALFKNISLNSDFVKSEDSWTGQLSFGIKDIQLPGLDVTVNSFNATVPFEQTQSSDTSGRGTVKVGNITYKNFNLGSLSGGVNNDGRVIAFSVLAPNVVLPDMAVKLNGQFGKDQNGIFMSEIHFNLPHYKLLIPFDLGAWFPKAKGISFQGEFEADGFFRMAHYGIKSGMRLKVNDASLNMKADENPTTVSGISLDLCLDDLVNIESLPSQNLRIDKVSFGTLSFENILALFNIESPKAILLETMNAQWCGGMVSVKAIRINPAVKSYSPVISCDRVNLAQVLRQFDVGQAEGSGTLNGNIPLIIKDDSIEFGNGFLYSTPGDSGKIHIQGGAIDSITDGIPDGTPQFDQLKLSQMALRDFDYDWVKLYINSEEENMVLKLQFDGKPAKPLPFVYKKEIGGFARVDVNSAGSLFQGIRLDVNIKLPFNKLLWYNKQMQNYLKQL